MRTLRAGLLAAVAAMAGWIPAASADPAETLVTVVTSPDPQTHLMDLVLTLQAVTAGAPASRHAFRHVADGRGAAVGGTKMLRRR